MISFTLLTDTPARLRNQLIARGIVRLVTNPEGQQQLVGVREGVEFVEVPNIIQTTAAQGTPGQPGYVPPVMDMRHAYLVKIVRAAEDDETAGLQQDDVDVDTGKRTVRSVLLRSKLGQWVTANSTPETITSADGRSWQARNVNNNFWLTISDDFGVWQ